MALKSTYSAVIIWPHSSEDKNVNAYSLRGGAFAELLYRFSESLYPFAIAEGLSDAAIFLLDPSIR